MPSVQAGYSPHVTADLTIPLPPSPFTPPPHSVVVPQVEAIAKEEGVSFDEGKVCVSVLLSLHLYTSFIYYIYRIAGNFVRETFWKSLSHTALAHCIAHAQNELVGKKFGG